MVGTKYFRKVVEWEGTVMRVDSQMETDEYIKDKKQDLIANTLSQELPMFHCQIHLRMNPRIVLKNFKDKQGTPSKSDPDLVIWFD